VKITPHLNGADEVRLEVEETISDLVGDTSVGTLGTVPFMERGATTTLTVRDQETVVIGGLVRDKIAHTTVKTPILGDIPILGALFRHKSDTVEKSNLVLVLTPYIIREQDDLRRIFERKMQERQEFIDHSTIFSMHDWQPHKDYTRTRGLLEEIRQRGMDVEERKKADEMMRPRDVKVHEGTDPIDLGPAEPSPRARPDDASTPAPPRAGMPSASRAIQRVEP
jgi:general secretion pathway protein D